MSKFLVVLASAILVLVLTGCDEQKQKEAYYQRQMQQYKRQIESAQRRQMILMFVSLGLTIAGVIAFVVGAANGSSAADQSQKQNHYIEEEYRGQRPPPIPPEYRHPDVEYDSDGYPIHSDHYRR